MKIIILSPNFDQLFDRNLISQIKKTGNLIIYKKIIPLTNIKQLYSKEEKILAIDPDFTKWTFSNDIFDKIPNLKTVCLQTTSFSWLDVNFLKQKNIPVINIYQSFSKESVSEYCLMLAIMLSRKIPVITKDQWQLNFNKHIGFDLFDKTAGIIGFGNNGKRLAQLCQAIGIKVVYWSKQSRDHKYQYVRLNQLFKISDYIFPCLAVNDKTVKLITDKMLKSMRKQANLITVFPLTKLYNHNLAIKLTLTEKIHGYAFEDTKIVKLNNKNKNIIAIPTVFAWATKESFKYNGQFWTENIIRAAKGDYRNRIN